MLNKIGLKYGLIGFGIYTLYVILSWQLNLKLLINPLVSFTLGLAIIGLSIWSQLEARKQNGGFLDFTYTAQVFMITAIVAVLGYYIPTAVVFNLIDPAAAKEVMRLSGEQSMETMNTIMGWMGQEETIAEIDPEIMNQAMDDAPNPFGPILILSFIFSLMMYMVVGLITALIFKRDEPIAFN